MPKNKLLVIVGAGASIDFGMPSVLGVADLLSEAAQDRYPLFENPETNLYRYMESNIGDYWRSAGVGRLPNFEDVLYAIFALAAGFPDGRFTSALGAFVMANPLPDVNWFGITRQVISSNNLREFGHYLVDTLLDEFRDRCRCLSSVKREELSKMRTFFAALSNEFEISIVTLNYDDIVYRTMPGLETGFDPDGRFSDERITLRRAWPCIIHLHGSVHFDMRDDYKDFMGFGGFHDIHWQEDLSQRFNQNASGRSSISTVEGPDFPTSAIVAGYGKPTQLLRRPFRIYFGELDRLIAQCDAALFLGYGFSDIHINLAFEKFRTERRRPVAVIDWAPDTAMNANGIEWANGYKTVTSVLGLFRNDKSMMSSLGYRLPNTVARLKEALEFEVSDSSDTPLAIWYNGMLLACERASSTASFVPRRRKS
jgi:SIR2-like domain